MSTGNRAARRVFAGCVLVLLACRPEERSTQLGSDTPTNAWWVDVTFAPTSTSVRGIDVPSIDRRWQRAEALDTVMVRSRVSADEVRQFTTSPLSFSVTADLDRDGVPEEFFVGVYERSDGVKGRFVAITRRGRPVQHFTDEGTAGFSALLRSDRDVRWYKCLECDDYETIKWSGRSYVLE